MPKDLFEILGRKEIRFSLKTEQRHIAISLACSIVSNLPQNLNKLRFMANQEENQPNSKFYELWLEQIKKNTDLKIKVEELETELMEKTIELSNSVSTKKAK